MDLTNYSEDIRHKIATLEDYRPETFEATIRIANEVAIVANRRDDQTLHSLCDYYIAYYYFNLRNCTEAIRFLDRALKDASGSEAWLEVSKYLNLLGHIFLRQGNPMNAMQAFAKSITISEKNLEKDEEFAPILIDSYEENAMIYYEIANYQQALKYELATDRIFKVIEQHDKYLQKFTRHLSNLVKIYIMFGDATNAGDIVAKIDSIASDNHNVGLEPYISIAHILWNDFSDNHRWDDVYINRLNSYFMGRNFKGKHIWEFFFALERMGSDEKYRPYFRSLVVKMDSFLDHTDLHGYKLQLSNLKLDYYERCGLNVKKAEELERFREYVNACHKTANAAMSLILSLEVMKALENEVINALVVREAMDDLTGLPNRKAFNDMADRFFERCTRKNVNLGLALITIDNVKKINDLYGYIIGDRCLVEVGNILKRFNSKTTFVARYVGAEFVVLFEGLSDNEITDRLRSISQALHIRTAEQELPEFTLASGICTHVPKGLNKIWDYTSCADLALLKAMQYGTGRGILVHHQMELGGAAPITIDSKGRLAERKEE